MDERVILRIRVRALLDAIEQAWPAGVERPFADVDAPLADRAAPALDRIADQLRTTLRELDRHLARGHPLASCWSGYRAAVAACLPFFEECLALRQGELARAATLDQGLCAVADRLLLELNAAADLGWSRFTIVDAGESFARLSGVVRLRYPELSVWDLPVVAHELGHFAAPRLERHGIGRSGRPFAELAARTGGAGPSLLEEHFADAFAAVTMGPAYACTSLLLRFDPQDGASVDPVGHESHPPAVERALVLIAVLRRLDADEERTLAAAVDRIEALWQRLVAAAGATRAPDAAGRSRLDDLAAELYAMLRDALPPGARHSAAREQRIRRLQRLLLDRDAAPELDPLDRVADVVNAGWRARIEPGIDDHARAYVSDWTDRLVRMAARRVRETQVA